MKTLLISIFMFVGICTAAPVQTVVLPAKFANIPVLIENSDLYKSVIEKNANLTNQLKKQESDWLAYSNKVTEQQKYDTDIQSKLLNDYNSGLVTIQRQSATIAKQETKLIMWRIYFFGLLTLIIVYFCAKTYLKTTFPIISNFLP